MLPKRRPSPPCRSRNPKCSRAGARTRTSARAVPIPCAKPASLPALLPDPAARAAAPGRPAAGLSHTVGRLGNSRRNGAGRIFSGARCGEPDFRGTCLAALPDATVRRGIEAGSGSGDPRDREDVSEGG
ncbi:hypothetical protein mvi_45870 [Methylobacterium indicum]|uniref:Uncharacterized protein n=1 Tax=Methylobacterium indicum TaxID=1775910 RepID=A0A8H8WX47_9HYPH|nr:hypothetical protein mvi_45870 [Methylobacterium indicum]